MMTSKSDTHEVQEAHHAPWTLDGHPQMSPVDVQYSSTLPSAGSPQVHFLSNRSKKKRIVFMILRNLEANSIKEQTKTSEIKNGKLTFRVFGFL